MVTCIYKILVVYYNYTILSVEYNYGQGVEYNYGQGGQGGGPIVMRRRFLYSLALYLSGRSK